MKWLHLRLESISTGHLFSLFIYSICPMQFLSYFPSCLEN